MGWPENEFSVVWGACRVRGWIPDGMFNWLASCDPKFWSIRGGIPSYESTESTELNTREVRRQFIGSSGQHRQSAPAAATSAHNYHTYVQEYGRQWWRFCWCSFVLVLLYTCRAFGRGTCALSTHVTTAQPGLLPGWSLTLATRTCPRRTSMARRVVRID